MIKGKLGKKLKEVPKGPSGETSISKKSRPNNTTPPKIILGPTPAGMKTPSGTESTQRSFWVHSPEDRKNLILDLVEEATSEIKVDMNEIKTQNKLLKTQLTAVMAENADIKRQLLRQETINKHNNLKFLGIYEHHRESKFDWNRRVLEVLNNAGISLHPKSITNSHRVGFKIGKNPRPIVVTFIYTEDHDFILAKSQFIYSKLRIRIEEHFPSEIEKKQARTETYYASSSAHLQHERRT